jgi:hypothetical protein
MKLISYLLKTDALKVLYFCSFYYTYTGCHKDCFTEIVECLTLIIFTCVHFFYLQQVITLGLHQLLILSLVSLADVFIVTLCRWLVINKIVFFWNVSITSVKWLLGHPVYLLYTASLCCFMLPSCVNDLYRAQQMVAADMTTLDFIKFFQTHRQCE